MEIYTPYILALLANSNVETTAKTTTTGSMLPAILVWSTAAILVGVIIVLAVINKTNED